MSAELCVLLSDYGNGTYYGIDNGINCGSDDGTELEWFTESNCGTESDYGFEFLDSNVISGPKNCGQCFF